MKKNYQIKKMTRKEFDTAVEWARKEGWNPGTNDAECFFETDPRGFFAGYLDDKIIAVGSAVIYDDDFAFCGFYIVDSKYRNQGFGLELTKERLKYVGNRNVGIDGVTDMLPKYERLGYKLAHNNARYILESSHLTPQKEKCIYTLDTIDFELISKYDAAHFPAQRDKFLNCWINQPKSYSIGYFKNEKLQGYGVIRPCIEGYKIGPLFADNPDIADELFQHLVESAKGQTVFLDIPENNQQAKALVDRYKMKKTFETARMYLKNEPELPMDEIYGITTFELG